MKKLLIWLIVLLISGTCSGQFKFQQSRDGNGCVLHVTCDGTNLKDNSYSGKTITNNGGTISTGVFGNSYYFYDTYFDITNYGTDLNFGANPFTIEFWYKDNGTSKVNAGIVTTSISSVSWCFFILSGNMCFGAGTGAAWDISNYSNVIGAVSTSSYNFFTVCRSGNTFIFYKDGVQTYTLTSASAIANATGMQIGRYRNNNTYASKGYVDNLKIYNYCKYSFGTNGIKYFNLPNKP